MEYINIFGLKQLEIDKKGEKLLKELEMETQEIQNFKLYLVISIDYLRILEDSVISIFKLVVQ